MLADFESSKFILRDYDFQAEKITKGVNSYLLTPFLSRYIVCIRSF